jgi:hypothetical protein
MGRQVALQNAMPGKRFGYRVVVTVDEHKHVTTQNAGGVLAFDDLPDQLPYAIVGWPRAGLTASCRCRQVSGTPSRPADR